MKGVSTKLALLTAWLLPVVLLGVLFVYVLWPTPPLPVDAQADTVLVLKSERKMQLLQNGQVLKTYRIALGQNSVGHKTQEGDERTPEGRYTLDFRNPRSIALLRCISLIPMPPTKPRRRLEASRPVER